MKYFASCRTLEELKKMYRELMMKNHPDHGGDVETAKAINAEYDEMFRILKDRHNATHDEAHQTTETPDEFKAVILALLNLDVIVELCGSWLWISGDTRPVKEQLKAMGCRWSSNKKMWYWHHEEDGSKWHRGRKTMEQIRDTYGSQVYTAGGRRAAAIEA